MSNKKYNVNTLVNIELYDKHSLIYFLKQKSMKYRLADDGVFSLKSGPSPLDWSLFTDTELDTSDPDLTLMTQNT